MRYVNTFVLLSVLVITTGCETLTKVGASALGAASKDGVSVDAQIGDRDTEVETDVGSEKATGDIQAKDNSRVSVKTEKSGARVENAGTVKVSNIPVWVFLLALTGWILPTPQDIVKTLWHKITKRKEV